jgi:DNA-binding transcriptional regulator YhcF (GntR family)
MVSPPSTALTALVRSVPGRKWLWSRRNKMKKLGFAVAILSLLFLIPALSAQDKQDVQVLKEKVEQKVAQMKAAGASDEEIKAFILEAKKKIEQLSAGNNGSAMDEKAFQAKIEEKAAKMRAAGASDEEIKKMVTEAKQKWSQQNANGNGNVMDEKAFKEKLEQKAAQMRAAGASEEEIKKMATEAKQKWSEQNSKTQKQNK